MVKIVLVEDDVKLCELLANYFRLQQFDVVTVSDGLQAPDIIVEQQPDLVILDLMLPGMDGLSICRQVRDKVSSKILMLTASDDDIDHVAGLEVGADDFVNKPIKPRVLLARIRMLLRRVANEADMSIGCDEATSRHHGNEQAYQFGALTINNRCRSCELDGREVSLTDSEFNLLWLLASHPDEVLTREYLVMETRGIKYDGLDRTIDNKVVTLRKKLDDNPALPRKIITVRGKGYLFIPDRW